MVGPSTLTILSPVPEPAAMAAPAAALAWDDLPDRVRVGVLSNGKPNTAQLLDGVLRELTGDPRFVATVRAHKESASRPADVAVLERLAAGADLVVDATAD